MQDCKYRLPCGWCDKKNDNCTLVKLTNNNYIIVDTLTDKVPTTVSAICNHEWECVDMTSNSYDYRCKKCGQTKKEMTSVAYY